MINFLHFIDEDIEIKKTLLSTMPTNTKRDIKKYNEKLISIEDKYKEYKISIKKYIDTKSKSFNIKEKDKNIDKLNKLITNLERVKFILNPSNTYVEKIGFDNLLYEINSYYNFDFTAMNNTINNFIEKFELAGIKLTSSDFDYTCYVNEYMTEFLQIKDAKRKDFDQLSEIFEKIYWINPDIVQHIGLNFRKLIRKKKKEFCDYITKIKKIVMQENSIESYEDCLKKLKDAYLEFYEVTSESVNDIIILAKHGEIDMNSYFEDSKFRLSVYESLMLDSSDMGDLNKFYDTLKKLKNNIDEYSNYIKFLPLLNKFKKEYENSIAIIENSNSDKKNAENSLKNIEIKILEKEEILEKLYKKISSSNIGLFKLNNHDSSKQLKMESIRQAKELYSLYKDFDKEYFNEKVKSILTGSLTVADVLHLYYSFDYYKKIAIQEAYNIKSYNEIIKYSEEFDLFSMNPTNMVVNSIEIFSEASAAKIIINRYRMDNINLNEENLNPDNLESLLNKVIFLLRINAIENSETTIQKIWFMAQVEKINKNENNK